MSLNESVQEYVARQPSYTWKRQIIRFLIRTIGFHVLTNATVYGEENVPLSGRTMLMMNHISLVDPVAAMGAVTKRFVIPMSKIENMDKPFLAPFINWWGAYYINRDGVDRKALLNSIELIKSGQLVLIAPEGTRQDALTRPKDGLAYVATKADAVIVPIAISGAKGWMDALKKFRRAKVSVTFGKPFRFKANEGERVPRETLSAMSEEAMYQLAITIPDPELRGEYSDISNATTEHIEFV